MKPPARGAAARRAGPHQVSLARALSKLGVASRSQARTIVQSGRVAVNGLVVRDPDAWVDLKTDRLSMDGRSLVAQKFMYLAMHKPAGIVTTRSDERGRKTVYDLLPARYRTLFPVGRLDRDSSGLLLFTNDTRFGERLSNARHGIPKRYLVELDVPVTAGLKGRFVRGMVLDDGTPLLPAELEVDPVDPTKCTVTLYEGRNRQIRRMFAAGGCTVIALHRISIGAITLGDLEEGKTRTITPNL